ncbi:Cof-type HAD-IIB family hydrolase [Microbacterium sp. TNHR37B]|uniref:Cof-type HAD-IIB family hydrolase n=1 Tax=Microbacterium sp. TNHR37B TaxID=1775956 RepID=UPI0007B274AC|nr:Cof-type HAD-IIB family hydrolase [Microbacterium sp. TNHR37B]KZE88699.1 Flavin mononucleotide phosphatase YbjI [Microbacterium sp. TNHR37B]
MPDPDIRLIAVDMDGTLLRPDGTIPGRLWPLLRRLRERGIAFAPASGRQLATLRAMFAGAEGELDYIAENGAHVVRGEQEVSIDALAPVFVARTIARLRALDAVGTRLGIVVCGERSAYVDDCDPVFLAETRKYYRALEVVDDVAAVEDRVLKLAVYDFVDGETRTAPALADLHPDHQVVVSGVHWVDVMNAGVDKGVALRGLQRALGVTPAQTVAFGDYLNDLELLRAADHSYAMADAHPDVAAIARHRAPSNAEDGVVTVIEGLLAAPATA